MASAAQASRGDRAWLQPGIIIKVMSPQLKEHGYYKQKGLVARVIDQYLGEVEMLSSGDVVRVDQAELETVIPSPGGAVLVLNGSCRGAQGSLVSIDVAKYQAQVRIGRGPQEGREVWLEYEDVCKLA